MDTSSYSRKNYLMISEDSEDGMSNYYHILISKIRMGENFPYQFMKEKY